MIKRLFISAMIINLLCSPVLALNFDLSADDEIRKDYNPSKLENDVGLPPLPKVLNDDIEDNSGVQPVSVQKSPTLPAVPKVNVVQKASATANVKKIPIQAETSFDKPDLPLTSQKPGMGSYATLHKGTKFWVETLNTISDKSRRGAKVTMVSLYPVTTTYMTIPMGTVFKGEIVDSHTPQLGNNGGLIAIKMNSMILNGGSQPISASIVKVNSKHIYNNNIKGKRGYFRSMYASTSPGRHFCGKMFRVSRNLAADGSSIFLTPFSLGMGVLAWGANAMASPVLATFRKGYHVNVEAGSRIRLELKQDVIIYN